MNKVIVIAAITALSLAACGGDDATPSAREAASTTSTTSGAVAAYCRLMQRTDQVYIDARSMNDSILSTSTRRTGRERANQRSTARATRRVFPLRQQRHERHPERCGRTHPRLDAAALRLPAHIRLLSADDHVHDRAGVVDSAPNVTKARHHGGPSSLSVPTDVSGQVWKDRCIPLQRGINEDLLPVVVVGLLTLAAAACGGDDDDSSSNARRRRHLRRAALKRLRRKQPRRRRTRSTPRKTTCRLRSAARRKMLVASTWASSASKVRL